jgi:glycosyltransferase involved in cell wall biosynthesis
LKSSLYISHSQSDLNRIIMDKNILVSISCTTYNHSEYIRECLDNFINQKTNFDYEIIIHDDASTDDTAAIIQEYVHKHPNLIFPIYQNINQFSQGQRGMMVRYNFARCRGKYIALCEGDDFWTDPYKLQKQVDFLEQNSDYVLCFHNALVIKDVQNRKKERRLFYNNYTKTDYNANDVIKTWLVPTASIVFRNSIKEYPQLLKESVFGDIALQVYLCEFGKMYFLNEVMSVYRINDGSITIKTINDPNHYKRLITQYKKMNAFFNNKYKIEIDKKIFLLHLTCVNAYKNNSILNQLNFFLKAIISSPLIALKNKQKVFNAIKAIGVTIYTGSIFKYK